MKKTAPKLQKPGKNDPLRAYRFSGALRHILSALYGIVLGYALMSGNPVVNYFAIALTVIFLYVVLKTLLGKLLVKITLHCDTPRVYQDTAVKAWATVRNRTPFIYPVSYLTLPEGAAGGADNDPRLFFYLKPFSKQHVALPVSFRHCGRYCLRLEGVRLMSAGGVVSIVRKPPKKALPEVAVLPAPLSLDICLIRTFPRIPALPPPRPPPNPPIRLICVNTSPATIRVSSTGSGRQRGKTG